MTTSLFSILLQDSGAISASAPPDHIQDAMAALFPEELEQISRAVEKRRQEFAKGRALARRLLSSLGHEKAPLLSSETRAPIWPNGIVGSITHTKDFVAVAVAKNTDLRGIGIDAEELRPIKENLWSRICTETELNTLRQNHGRDMALWVGLLFSCKEAFYKAQHPLTKTFLGFHDVEVALKDSTFTITLVKPASEQFATGTQFSGRFSQGAKVWASAVTIP